MIVHRSFDRWPCYSWTSGKWARHSEINRRNSVSTRIYYGFESHSQLEGFETLSSSPKKSSPEASSICFCFEGSFLRSVTSIPFRGSPDVLSHLGFSRSCSGSKLSSPHRIFDCINSRIFERSSSSSVILIGAGSTFEFRTSGGNSEIYFFVLG